MPMTVPMMFAAMAATPFRRRFPRGAGEVPVLRGRGFSMVSQFVQTKVKEEAPAHGLSAPQPGNLF
jgi:hypothetical protein